MLPGTSQMTYHDLKILTIQETVKEYCQRYHDRLEKHLNNFEGERNNEKTQERKTYRSINLIFHS